MAIRPNSSPSGCAASNWPSTPSSDSSSRVRHDTTVRTSQLSAGGVIPEPASAAGPRRHGEEVVDPIELHKSPRGSRKCSGWGELEPRPGATVSSCGRGCPSRPLTPAPAGGVNRPDAGPRGASPCLPRAGRAGSRRHQDPCGPAAQRIPRTWVRPPRHRTQTRHGQASPEKRRNTARARLTVNEIVDEAMQR